jgi:hypothetical protein
MTRPVLAFLLVAGITAWPARGHAAWSTYAIVVGHNGALPGTGRDPLEFADDDAIRNAELWRQLGSTVQLLTSPDEDTERQFPTLAPTGPPTVAALQKAVSFVNSRAQAAREAGHFTVTYFAYSGHGGVRDGDGYLALEDGALDRLSFYSLVLSQLQTDRVHVIIDACSAAAMARGGTKTEVRPFRQPIYRAKRSQFTHTGFLLPSKSLAETYEWRRYRGGVFGHLVRSGLRGAADADADGRVSYREVESFVARAQTEVDAEFRPATLADPPTDDDTLLYLHGGTENRVLIVDADYGDHLYIVDEQRNRHADFRPGNQTFRILLPPHDRPLYAVNADKALIYTLPSDSPLVLSQLTPRPYDSSRARGPSEAFERLFSSAYDFQAHLAHQQRRLVYVDLATTEEARARARWRGVTLALGVTAASLGAIGTGLLGAGFGELNSIDATMDPTAKMETRRLGRYLEGAGWGVLATAVLSAGVAALWHWLAEPEQEP